MNVSSLADEIIYHEEGIVATRSASGLVICLPSVTSAEQQLGVIAALWDLCMDAREEISREGTEYSIKIEVEDELSLPLIVTMYAIDAELDQVGRKLLVSGAPRTSSWE